VPQAVLPVLRFSRRLLAPSTPRTALLWRLARLYCVLSLLTRLALLANAAASGQVAWMDAPGILLIGAGYDVITALYIVAPLALYLAFAPSRFLGHAVPRALLHAAIFAAVFGFTYLGIVEYFFFDEFNARFNFVAVEYLIYPHEVFVNIWQTYPVARGLAAAAAASWLAWRWLRPVLARIGAAPDAACTIRLQTVSLLALVACAQVFVTLDTGRTHENRVANELAANGVYSFFNAALRSRLDYMQFYLTVPEHEAAERVRHMVRQQNARFIANASNPLARKVVSPVPAKLLNVVVLLQESLGAEFVGAYGDTRGLTPNIDAIARDGIVFERTYATGTRTVRGMEAVTASFPPVPAEAIVKRPHNEHMFNWSNVMHDAGYQPTFIYGGYGAFDNMNYFFGNNGYRTIDRSHMDRPRFSNIWGVSDEDLFDHALKVFDQQHARGERIFSVVMSTSNHKPFTFPTGVPGVQPKGGGREAGVRYADYAIGRFAEALRKRPYFDNTAIVIVADHGARIYGKEDFPLRSYEIPFIVYAPRHFAPQRVSTITSQLDVAPTVLGLLGITYESAFFGRDALAERHDSQLVPLNHNRDIGLLEGDLIHQLGFHKRAVTFEYDARTNVQHARPRDKGGVLDAASVFQTAYLLYARRHYDAH
jgi:phosphoglycerol transferase MdoB-like AlkP superfamily enzyme